jgi:hypothetical protein
MFKTIFGARRRQFHTLAAALVVLFCACFTQAPALGQPATVDTPGAILAGKTLLEQTFDKLPENDRAGWTDNGTFEQGKSRLGVTSDNAAGGRGKSLRFVRGADDEKGAWITRTFPGAITGSATVEFDMMLDQSALDETDVGIDLLASPREGIKGWVGLFSMRVRRGTLSYTDLPGKPPRPLALLTPEQWHRVQMTLHELTDGVPAKVSLTLRLSDAPDEQAKSWTDLPTRGTGQATSFDRIIVRGGEGQRPITIHLDNIKVTSDGKTVAVTPTPSPTPSPAAVKVLNVADTKPSPSIAKPAAASSSAPEPSTQPDRPIVVNIPGRKVEPYRVFPDGEQKPVPGYENFPLSKIEPVNGGIFPVIDGVPSVRAAISSTSDQRKSLAEKRPLGFQIIKSRAIPLGGKLMRREAQGSLDASMSTLLSAIPDAQVILRLNVQPSNEFLNSHPYSRVTGSAGQVEFQERFNRNYFTEITRYRPSWASRHWREFVEADLRDLLAYAATRPYAKHIIGINLSAGHTGEFDQWFGGEGGNDGDWCGESLARFRDWLFTKYQGDVHKLRADWADPNVTFETAWIELKQALQSDETTSFIDPTETPAARARMSYMLYRNDQIGETIASWCRTIKQATGGRMIAGAIEAAYEEKNRYLNTSPWIDYGCAPGTYFYREPGNHRRNTFIAEEQRRHGKWYFQEMDMRTHLWSGPRFGVDTMDKTLAVLKRTHAEQIIDGIGGYWYEFNGSVYADPTIWKLFRRQSVLSELSALQNTSQPTTDVAVIFSETNGLLAHTSGDLRTNILSRLGTSYHAMHLETLIEQDPATLPYRIYFFISTPSWTTAQRDWVAKNLKNNNRWLVFVRPGGTYWPEAATPFSLENSTALHGIKLVAKTGDTRNSAMLVAKGSPLTELTTGQRLTDPVETGENRVEFKTARPTAWTMVQDDSAVTLTTWADGSAASAMKDHGSWKSVYVPTSRLSPEFLRSIIKSSGAHQYIDHSDDVIYAGRNMLNIHTRRDGTRTIKLRQAADLYDLYEERFIGKGQSSYDVSMKALENHLYFLGDPTTALRERDAKVQKQIDQNERVASERTKSAVATPALGAGPFLPVDSGRMQHFLFLGPIEVTDGPRGIDAAAEIEVLNRLHLQSEPAGLTPKAGQTQTTLDGQTLTWRTAFNGATRLNIHSMIDNPDRQLVWYACVYVQSATGGKHIIELRTERSQRLFFDGVNIGQRGWGDNPAQLTFPITLEPNKRHLLLWKVYSTGGGNSGWSCKITNDQGEPVPDVRVWLEPG